MEGRTDETPFLFPRDTGEQLLVSGHPQSTHLSKTTPKSDVIDLNSMYALVLGLLLVLGLSGDASGMCGESR